MSTERPSSGEGTRFTCVCFTRGSTSRVAVLWVTPRWFRSTQIRALDMTYNALDQLLMSSTQWNYTADSSHLNGDQWNREDLSIFSPDDQTDPEDLDSGGRAVAGFSRPYAPHAAGRPLSVSFDRETRTFELEVESDPEVAAPTVVFVPRVQYPKGVGVEVSAGETSYDEKRQRLEWQTDVRGRVTLRMTPA